MGKFNIYLMIIKNDVNSVLSNIYNNIKCVLSNNKENILINFAVEFKYLVLKVQNTFDRISCFRWA